MTELHVKANNTKSFDFTSAAPAAEKPLVQVVAPKDVKLQGSAKAQSGVPICLVRNVHERTRAEDLAALFAVYGNAAGHCDCSDAGRTPLLCGADEPAACPGEWA